jgi:hypothetical protein
VSKDNQRLANWRLWIDRLGLGDDFVRVVDGCAAVVASGERIPDAVVQHLSRSIVKARGLYETGRPAAPDGVDPVAVEALTWMLPEIRRAARTVARKWPQVTSQEDMTQSIFMHFLERTGSTLKLADMVPGERAASLIKIGHQVASQEREKYDRFSGQFTYSVDEVRTALDDGGLTKGADVIRVVHIDVQKAMEYLESKTPGYATALVRKYVDEESPSNKSEENLLYRAVETLTSRMNRNRNLDRAEFTNGGGRRSLITNAEARDAANNDYAGEDTP